MWVKAAFSLYNILANIAGIMWTVTTDFHIHQGTARSVLWKHWKATQAATCKQRHGTSWMRLSSFTFTTPAVGTGAKTERTVNPRKCGLQTLWYRMEEFRVIHFLSMSKCMDLIPSQPWKLASHILLFHMVHSKLNTMLHCLITKISQNFLLASLMLVNIFTELP